ncbi:hypothetical protein J6590_090845 [Homalodisca vitripennis]|nr:hypothetical protein J6590_090845 [Homalodisca vitripennis]
MIHQRWITCKNYFSEVATEARNGGQGHLRSVISQPQITCLIIQYDLTSEKLDNLQLRSREFMLKEKLKFSSHYLFNTLLHRNSVSPTGRSADNVDAPGTGIT